MTRCLHIAVPDPSYPSMNIGYTPKVAYCQTHKRYGGCEKTTAEEPAPMTEPTTVTAFKAQQRDSRIAFAMDRLLHRLKAFVRIYPHIETDVVPDHDVVWVVDPDSGPGFVIANALQATPALWMALLPDEVCVVPKSALANVTGNNPHIVEHLARMGADIVESRSFRLQEEEREREYERRWRE